MTTIPAMALSAAYSLSEALAETGTLTALGLRASIIRGLQAVGDEIDKHPPDLMEMVEKRSAEIKDRAEAGLARVRAKHDAERQFVEALPDWLNQLPHIPQMMTEQASPAAFWLAFSQSLPSLPFVLDWSRDRSFSVHKLARDIQLALKTLVKGESLTVHLPASATVNDHRKRLYQPQPLDRSLGSRPEAIKAEKEEDVSIVKTFDVMVIGLWHWVTGEMLLRDVRDYPIHIVGPNAGQGAAFVVEQATLKAPGRKTAPGREFVNIRWAPDSPVRLKDE